MIEVVSLEEPSRWDGIVASFKEYDVYYLSGYVRAFRLHGDGEPLLYHYTHGDTRGICVFMRRDVSELPFYRGLLEFGECFDLVTPYGYGGFILEGDWDIEDAGRFNREFLERLESERVVSVFVRFHPQLGNASLVRSLFEVVDLGKTVEMRLGATEAVWENLTSKNRNVIRKAQKSGVVIRHGQGMDLLQKFKEVYDGTMRRDGAEDYYFFEEKFYRSIGHDLAGNHEVFYAEFEGRIISMAIMLFANERMHYHLSGSLWEYRPLAASNLLLYEAACWGAGRGFRTFHLGGGLGSREDNLFKFKQAFSRGSGLVFSIGKLVVNREKYTELVRIRAEVDEGFDMSSKFFPLYRS